MSPLFLRVLLAANTTEQAHFWEQYLRDAGHEVVTVAPQAEAALRAARLIHPDVVVLGIPLLDTPDPVALAAVLQAAAPVPVLLVPSLTELSDLLSRQMARRAAEL